MTNEEIVAGFLPWVRAQESEEEYNFGNIYNCPLAQYGRHLFPATVIIAGPNYIRVNHEILGARFNDITLSELPWTFGALADRLERANG